MTNTRKDAGEARQRPKPPTTAEADTAATTPTSRPAGIAPTFDATTAQVTQRVGAYKGMISNPVVRAWAGGAAQVTAQAAAAAPPTPGEAPQTAPETDSQPASVDAGAAPNPGPNDKS
jgi:hypothetical protein